MHTTKSKKTTRVRLSLRQVLQKRGACGAALQWVGNKSLSRAWRECRRPSWLTWYLYNIVGLTRTQIGQLICRALLPRIRRMKPAYLRKKVLRVAQEIGTWEVEKKPPFSSFDRDISQLSEKSRLSSKQRTIWLAWTVEYIYNCCSASPVYLTEALGSSRAACDLIRRQFKSIPRPRRTTKGS